MKEDLTKDLFQKAKSLGADLVSACAVAQMEKYEGAKREIEKIDPEAKSILVFGVRMVSSAIRCSRENIRIPQFATQMLYDDLRRIGFSLMKELDELGYHAAGMPTHLPVPMIERTKGLIAELSLREIAYEAGLGSIGKSGLLITEEFGPRVRFGAIITNAELKPGKPMTKNLCADCDLCIEACPTGALKTKGVEAIELCAKHHMKYGLPGLIRFGIKMIKAETEEEKITLLRSPEFWEFWQNLNTGIFYYCFDCLNSCPIGK